VTTIFLRGTWEQFSVRDHDWEHGNKPKIKGNLEEEVEDNFE